VARRRLALKLLAVHHVRLRSSSGTRSSDPLLRTYPPAPFRCIGFRLVLCTSDDASPPRSVAARRLSTGRHQEGRGVMGIDAPAVLVRSWVFGCSSVVGYSVVLQLCGDSSGDWPSDEAPGGFRQAIVAGGLPVRSSHGVSRNPVTETVGRRAPRPHGQVMTTSYAE
jgi:hypothetical protein